MPQYLTKLFWDVRAKDLDFQKNADYVIERILEFGGIDAYKWMMRKYSAAQVKQVIRNSRLLSPKSANFWALIFKIKHEEILCLSSQFRKKQRKIWKH